MIQMTDVTKTFGGLTALDGLSCTIEAETIYGLVGSNGAGKSTFLRLIAGVYQADSGQICIDGKPVYENLALKNEIFYLSDELYFLPQATMNSMAAFYRSYYSNFSMEVYRQLCAVFPLDPKKRLATFSKGMQRQAGLVLALSTCPSILLLDEAFDGLDPVIRSVVRKILVELIGQRGTTILIASHNLRELEDLCDHVGLLHRGGLVLERDLDSLKLNICKFHCAFEQAPSRDAFSELELTKFSKRGNLITFTAKGNRGVIEKYVSSLNPVFLEAIPLTLEEVFIDEMEGVGYEFNSIQF